MGQLVLHVKTDGATGTVVGQTQNTGDHFYPFAPNNAGGSSNGMQQGVIVSNGYIVNVIFQDSWRNDAPTDGDPGNGNFNGGAVALGEFNFKGNFVPYLKSAGY